MEKHLRYFILLLSFLPINLFAQSSAKIFSTAGFYSLENAGRKVESFNPGWRFFKGDIKEAELNDFSDNSWEVVNLPHSVELVPSEASGCKNYQGVAWYRKHFVLSNEMADKKVTLYFEAIMGKCKIFLNGKLVKENYGGYLPVILDLSQLGIVPGAKNVIAVRTDNSDDSIYPPGKPQDALDFAYFGGIYRDVWMVATAPVHITDAIQSGKTAGGGVFVHYEEISDNKATVVVETEVRNESPQKQQLKLETVLKNATGMVVGKASNKITLAAGAELKIKQSIIVINPDLWTPDSPSLYNLNSLITGKDGKPVDGYYNRIGIRKIEFRGKDGFFLNNKPFNDKLIGANRHQDFAYIGNALPNSGQWRDAKKLRDAGMRIIRSAHYPQDPSFMDACDELGLFVIVATPGWQFWNADTIFARRIYTNISNMVRRDRNHASVIMWEPILNETRFPADFSKKAYDLLHSEYPYQGCFAACDEESKGADFYDVLYAHPLDKAAYKNIKQSVFTREWGDNVDNWSSHNSPSRVSRDWGEVPQLVQAIHYANPSYPFTCYQTLYQTPAQHVGGCLWHPFDHQRGYHPDPFWGGIMDAFRQPKYSYYMFESQRDPKIKHLTADSGPMIYIANEMTPFSPNDVTVFTNCDQVKLTFFDKEPRVKTVEHTQPGMPYQPVVFKNVYNFMDIKELHRMRKSNSVKLTAEGLIDNKVVATTVKMPANRPEKIMLSVDNEGLSLIADGSDIVTVIASITDSDGNVKRLNKEKIRFTIEGEGEIIGDEHIGANPRAVEWGTAPVLIRSTTRSGVIKITASILGGGSISPQSATLEIVSVKSSLALNFQEERQVVKGASKAVENKLSDTLESLKLQLQKANEELNKYKLKEVERDQEFFEGKKPAAKTVTKPL